MSPPEELGTLQQYHIPLMKMMMVMAMIMRVVLVMMVMKVIRKKNNTCFKTFYST